MSLNYEQIVFWLRFSAGICWFIALMNLIKLLDGLNPVILLKALAGIWTGIALLKRGKIALYVAIVLIGMAFVFSLVWVVFAFIIPAMQG